MLFRITILFAFFFPYELLNAQQLFYQNSIFGGVKGSGFSQGVNTGEISGVFNIDSFSPESYILDAFLFVGRHGQPDDLEVIFNNDIYEFNEQNQISASFISPEYGGFSGVHCINVKNSVSTFSNSYSLTFFQSQLSPSHRFVDFYLVIIYENLNLSPLTVSIYTNTSNFQSNVSYLFTELNPIRNDLGVAYAMHNGYICDTNIDGTYVHINDIDIGLIGGNNQGSGYCGGPSSFFEYYNENVFGLMESIANSTMSNNDVLANIQFYITNFSTEITVDLITQLINNKTNAYWTSIFVFSSPCQPFPHSLLTSDTTTCANSLLELGASGGIAYEWLPQTNLSCYNCPNPIFTGDSTINYTVRIWSTDSCSVVQPVRVRVLPQPNFESIDITENICGFESGSILGTSEGSALPHTYQLNDSAPQNNFSFSNLPTGTYTINVSDANGCSRDSTVQILEINNVQAAFTINPSTGAAPLQVQTENNSQNATQYEWFWEDQSSTLINPSITLDTAGGYTLTLVAGNGAAHCNDTFSLQIVVYDSLQIVIPNVFTPNNDNANDWFGITSNRDISGTLIILNRWGNLMLESTFSAQTGVFENLWNGASTSSAPASTGLATAPDGVYFYRIIVNEEDVEFSGFVHLVR
jgi:gliding motility-associated-like protein